MLLRFKLYIISLKSIPPHLVLICKVWPVHYWQVSRRIFLFNAFTAFTFYKLPINLSIKDFSSLFCLFHFSFYADVLIMLVFLFFCLFITVSYICSLWFFVAFFRWNHCKNYVIFAKKNTLHFISYHFISYNSHVANLEKESQLTAQQRPIVSQMEWSRTGLEIIIFAKR